MTESSPALLIPEALDALSATGRRIERTDDALSLYQIDGRIIALAFRLAPMVGEALVQ